MSNGANKRQEETGTTVKTRKPSKYKVFIFNDDFTPMDFVVFILITIFKKSRDEAEYLTMQVHKKGKGLAGIYMKDIAEHKISHVKSLAKSQGYPLDLKMEKE